MNALPQPAAPSQYTKIFADGTRAPADDPRTDHVIVLDAARNIEIYVNSVGVKGEPAPAKKLAKAVAALDVRGGGWRMATPHEAFSIVNHAFMDPAVDPSLFPGIKPRRHFTSEPCKWAPARAAWCVLFYYGLVNLDSLVVDGWALAVRPAGQ